MKILEEIPTEFQRIIMDVGKSHAEHLYLLISLRNILLTAMQNSSGTFYGSLTHLSSLSDEHFRDNLMIKSVNQTIFILQISANMAGLKALLVWTAANYISIPEIFHNLGFIGLNIDPSTVTESSDSTKTLNGNIYNGPISMHLITRNEGVENISFFDLFCRQIHQLWKVLTRVRSHLKYICAAHDVLNNQINKNHGEEKGLYITLSNKLQEVIILKCYVLSELLAIRTPDLQITEIQLLQQTQIIHHNEEYFEGSIRVARAVYRSYLVILSGWEAVLQFDGNGNGIQKWNEELLKFSSSHSVNITTEYSRMTPAEGSSIRYLEHSGAIAYGNQGFPVPAFLSGLIDLTAGFTERHTVSDRVHVHYKALRLKLNAKFFNFCKNVLTKVDSFTEYCPDSLF